jgi:hypothetical protein
MRWTIHTTAAPQSLGHLLDRLYRHNQERARQQADLLEQLAACWIRLGHNAEARRLYGVMMRIRATLNDDGHDGS